MHKSLLLDRRTLLRGAGGVVVALPFLEAMLPRRAAAAAAPKRLWVSFTPNGAVLPSIVPTGGERDFKLPVCLAPLAKHQQDLIVIDGLTNRANDRALPGSGHYAGGPTCLSGAPIVPGGKIKGSATSPAFDAGGITLDQAIAGSPAGATRFRSLQVGHQGGYLVNYLSASGKGQFLPNEPDLLKLYAKLFDGTPTTNTSGGPSPELVRLRAQRKTVLDAVKADLDGLNKRLGANDRILLDAHATGIGDLERSLDLALAPAGANCSKPQAPSAGAFQGETTALPTLVGVAQKLAAYAFQCDLTRVVTNMWVKSSSRQTYPWIGVKDRHHDISHKTDAGSLAQLTKIDVWWGQVMADFVSLLKTLPDAAGGTVFDHTLVLWLHELSEGSDHTSLNMPWIMAGGLGGSFATGRFHRFPGRTTNDVLTTIAQAFGIESQTFGPPNLNKGPLPLA